MNLGTWNGLPKDVQKVLMEVGRETEEWSYEQAIAGDKKYVELLKKKVTLTLLTRELTAPWSSVVQPAYDKWVAECEKTGHGSQAREIMEILEAAR